MKIKHNTIKWFKLFKSPKRISKYFNLAMYLMYVCMYMSILHKCTYTETHKPI